MWRSGRRDDARLLGLLAVLVVYGLLSLSRVIGTVAPYLFYWRIPLALLVLVATAAAVVHRVAPNGLRGSSEGRALAVLVTSVLVVALPVLPMTADLLSHDGRIDHLARFERSVERLGARASIHRLAGETILVRPEGTTLGGVEAGVIDALDRAGVDVKVDESRSFQFGDGRGSPAEVDQTWIVSEEGIRISQSTLDRDRRFVARLRPLGRAGETAIVHLQTSLAAALAGAGRADLIGRLDSPLVDAVVPPDVPGIDRADLAALADLNRRVERSGLCRCAIVALRSTP